jgi:hypothetical protein
MWWKQLGSIYISSHSKPINSLAITIPNWIIIRSDCSQSSSFVPNLWSLSPALSHWNQISRFFPQRLRLHFVPCIVISILAPSTWNLNEGIDYLLVPWPGQLIYTFTSYFLTPLLKQWTHNFPKDNHVAGLQWLTPVLLGIQETEIWRIKVQSQPRQIVLKTLSQKYPTQI